MVGKQNKIGIKGALHFRKVVDFHEDVELEVAGNPVEFLEGFVVEGRAKDYLFLAGRWRENGLAVERADAA